MMRQNASTQNHGIGPGEAVFADLDRLGSLAAGFKVDGMGQKLRAEPSDRGECADAHTRGAIDQMPAADAGVTFDN
jgi:hypothetical protein